LFEPGFQFLIEFIEAVPELGVWSREARQYCGKCIKVGGGYGGE
jgi:hypothetical protein